MELDIDLAEIPAELFALTELTYLDLSHNRRTRLSRKLTRLVELDLSDNPIPARIVDRTLQWVEANQERVDSEFADYGD